MSCLDHFKATWIYENDLQHETPQSWEVGNIINTNVVIYYTVHTESSKKRGIIIIFLMMQYNYNIMSWRPSGPILCGKINLSRHTEIHKSHLHLSLHLTPHHITPTLLLHLQWKVELFSFFWLRHNQAKRKVACCTCSC